MPGIAAVDALELLVDMGQVDATPFRRTEIPKTTIRRLLIPLESVFNH